MTKTNLILLLLLFSFQKVFSQQTTLKPIAKQVTTRLQNGEKPVLISPFKKVVKSKFIEMPEVLKPVSWGLEPDLNVIKGVMDRSPEMIDMLIPNPDGIAIHLILYKKDPGSPGSFMSFSDGRPSIPLPGKHYRGIIKDDVNSLVSITFFDDQVIGLICNKNGNFNLGLLQPVVGNHLHIYYNDKPMAEQFNFACGTADDDGHEMNTHPLPAGSRDNGDCVLLYWESDYSIFQAKGVGTMAFMSGTAGQVNVMYANEGITTFTNEIKIWTTPSPYTGATTGARLASFQANNGTLNGTLATLIDNPNIGGVAAGFDGICNSNYDNSMCYASIAGLNFANVPNYSWPVNICTHELGHLFGSRHTHACVWNGNNTAIDGCAGYVEGTCSLPGDPPGGGTIMSYCHNSPVGINLALGFGPQPSAVINNTINNALCLSQGCGGCATCPISGFSISVTGCNNNNTCTPNDDFYPCTGTVTHQSCASGTGDGKFTIVYNPGVGQIIFGPFTYTSGTSTSFTMYLPYGATTGTVVNAIDNDFPCNVNGSIAVSPSPLLGCSNYAPPVVTCPSNKTLACNQSTLPASTGTATAANCDGTALPVTYTDVTILGSCPQNYTIQRTWSATDQLSNVGTCVQLIVVQDLIAPIITCPTAVSVSCASSVPAPNIALVSASDACGGTVNISFVSDAISAQTCTNKYTITRTYRATDLCGNSATCAQIITVNDIIAPTISCPANLNFTCASAVPAPNVNQFTASDNCTGAVTKSFVSDIISNQICANKYTITRTYRATDICGNSATCAQTITINDNIAPIFTNNLANITIECDQEIPTVPSVSATDNCTGAVKIIYEESSTKGIYLNFCNAFSYVITRKWIASDVCGNTALLTQTVTVQDTKSPSFINVPPAFITVECDEDNNNNVDPIAVDGCDGNPSLLLDIKYKPYLNGCVNNYTAIYTWTAGDKCGNTTQYVQYIFVVDTTAPEIKCPENIVMNSEVPMVVTWPQPKAYDFCDGLILPKQTKGPVNGSIFNPGTKTLIEYTATDGCGNTETCTFTVSIKTSNGTKATPGFEKYTETNSGGIIYGKQQFGGATELFQNEPNPFESSTFIRFNLPSSQSATLTITDINGKVVKLVEREFPTGENKIEILNADFLVSGIYFYSLKTKDFFSTKKMLYIK